MSSSGGIWRPGDMTTWKVRSTRLEDCLWWRGVKRSTQPSGLAEHKHLPAGDTEEAFWRARSHPGKCPEGKWTYGARVQRRSQNGFNILKILTTWDKAETWEEASPTPSPIQNTREAKPHPARSDMFLVLTRIGRAWSYSSEEGPRTCQDRRERKQEV